MSDIMLGDHAKTDHGSITSTKMVTPRKVKSSLMFTFHRVTFVTPRFARYERVEYEDGTVIFFPDRNTEFKQNTTAKFE